MRLLDDIFTNGAFSIAELSACVRDGEMSPVDFGFILSDVPDDRWVRARVVGSAVDSRCIAASWSAAWVHGAIQTAPGQHTVALRNGLRIRVAPHQRFDIAQMSFDDSDVWETQAPMSPLPCEPPSTSRDSLNATTGFRSRFSPCYALPTLIQLTLRPCWSEERTFPTNNAPFED